MNKSIIFILLTLVLISLGWWGNDKYQKLLKNVDYQKSISLIKPLEKYSIENLRSTEIKPVKIKLEEKINSNNIFTSNIFSFEFDPTLKNKNNKKVTGLINLPVKSSLSPVVVLLRGYVDQSIYQTGGGTKRVGEFFAENGYITLAPDFLGYGGSSEESGNIFETRFQTYTTVLTLLKSINQENIPMWDGKNIFIWAHSNGGQVALTTLEITGADYTTVLWAPVTKPFPYSILYYTDESQDEGKFIRKELANFEKNYDVNKYSLTNYLDKINAPIEYHLGISDDAIPLSWGDEFVSRMKKLEKEVTY